MITNLIYLTKAELFKFKSKKLYVLPIIISIIPVALAVIISSNISGLEVDGTFSIATFGPSMWQFLWTVFAPQLVVIYMVVALNYDDEHNHEIIYEVTKNRTITTILFSKILALSIEILGFMLLFFLFSIMGFDLFIKKSSMNVSNVVDNTMVIQCGISVLSLLIIGLVTYTLITYFKTIVIVILLFIMQTVISMSSNIVGWWEYIPGAIMFNHSYTGQLYPVIIQVSLLLCIGIVASLLKAYQFKSKKIFL